MHLYLNFMQHKPCPIIPLFHLRCGPGQNVNSHKWISSRFMLRLGFAQSTWYERQNLKHRELHKKMLNCSESKMYVTGNCYLSSILLCLTCCELAVYFITLGYFLIKLRLWYKSSLIYKVLYSVKLRRQKLWNPTTSKCILILREKDVKKLKSFMLTLELYPPVDLCQNKRFINTRTSVYFYQEYGDVISFVRQRQDDGTIC